MKKVYNFSAGPGVLPASVLKAASAAAIEFAGTGMSLMEMSHRSKPVVNMFNETESLIRELLNVPSNYKVLFLQGGASLQFCMVPLNVLGDDEVADYTDTGAWAAKAIKEAKQYGKVNVVSSSKESIYNHIPKDFQQNPNAKYLHVTSNNTIYGTQWKTFPTPLNPNGFLIADMSSDIFSRPIDVSQFGIIYAGAQKNMGPAGVTLVIIREDLVGCLSRKIPTMLDYKTHVEGESMFNTPPVFSVYVVNQTMHWLKNLGGLTAIQEINERKAAKLYAEIERNSCFRCPVAEEDRSLMNVVFVMNKPELEPEFASFAKARNLEQLAGHRSVGGFRASIYNAMTEDGVDALVEAMKEFEENQED